jgi:hypothetical protein
MSSHLRLAVILQRLRRNDEMTGAKIMIFPEESYVGLFIDPDSIAVAQFFQGHGTAAFVVRYRLPSDSTMQNKSIVHSRKHGRRFGLYDSLRRR